MRILVVDDEIDIREFVQYNLVKEGYEVECAVNGRDALTKAAEFRPHLILMDMMDRDSGPGGRFGACH